MQRFWKWVTGRRAGLGTMMVMAGAMGMAVAEIAEAGRHDPFAAIKLEQEADLGDAEALRTYVEFADGRNRGMYDPGTDAKGFPDEDYDATTAMVINWHTQAAADADADAAARLKYRRVHPTRTDWQRVQGQAEAFWHRDEQVNRVILIGLRPNSVYAYRVREGGEAFHLRTMPASLDERPVRIVLTGDHQSPNWSDTAHANAKQAAEQEPDMFVVAGDFVNCEGRVNADTADRWARYLDHLYAADGGYFLGEREIDGKTFENLVIPHVGVLGNHETGERHHLRWPACVCTNMAEPGYPRYVAANWMQLLFHWPYSSENFYSEFRPDHPNMAEDEIREGYGKGGFGSLSFGDYLLLIGLDNSQNFEALPDKGLKDWRGEPITNRWPWYETHHAEVRQDLWLKDLLEPEAGPTAGERYTHILPVFHRGLFGTVRLNMSLKNRPIFEHWLPVLHRNGVKMIKEGHDHSYTRTVPMTITEQQPPDAYVEKVYYEAMTWEMPDYSQAYLDEFFAVRVLRDEATDEIVGWTHGGHYITHDAQGMIAQGHGGWAAGRRNQGDRGGGNAGLWFVDEAQGGGMIGGGDSFHITVTDLAPDTMTIRSYRPEERFPIHKARWDNRTEAWLAFDFAAVPGEHWVDYDAWEDARREDDVAALIEQAKQMLADDDVPEPRRQALEDRHNHLQALLANRQAYEEILAAAAELESALTDGGE